MKENILGYLINTLSAQACIDDVFDHLLVGTHSRWLACMNPHSYAVSLNDAHFECALYSADWLLPDGVGVVYASRMLGGAVKARVTGSDVFHGLHALMNTHKGMSVFFLGASEDTLAEIRLRMAKNYPNVRIAGTFSPPFKPIYSDAELNTMVEAINRETPDVLWVGMTAPKQEKWIFENLFRLDVKFAGAIGAVFDFYAGNVKRSHPVFQQLGLEWLPRLLQQPGRLWKRTFVSAPVFVLHVIKQATLRRLRR